MGPVGEAEGHGGRSEHEARPERSRLKDAALADEPGAAKLGQDGEYAPGVLAFRLAPAFRYAGAIALAQGMKGGLVLGPHQRPDARPLGVGPAEYLLGLAGGADEPGDAVLFTQLCIHRGRYHTDKLRRSLMISVKKRAAAEFTMRERGLNYASDQPWFLLPGYFDGVSEDARAFFQEFVDFYAPHWRARLTEVLKYSSLVQRLVEAGEPYPFFSE